MKKKKPKTWWAVIDKTDRYLPNIWRTREDAYYEKYLNTQIDGKFVVCRVKLVEVKR